MPPSKLSPTGFHLLLTKATSRPFSEGHIAPLHHPRVPTQPPLRDELVGILIHLRVAMHQVGAHAHRSPRRDRVLLVLDGHIGRDARQTSHEAVAESVFSLIRQFSVCYHVAHTNTHTHTRVYAGQKTYRKASLMTACKYGNFSSSVQVGTASGHAAMTSRSSFSRRALMSGRERM